MTHSNKKSLTLPHVLSAKQVASLLDTDSATVIEKFKTGAIACAFKKDGKWVLPRASAVLAVVDHVGGDVVAAKDRIYALAESLT